MSEMRLIENSKDSIEYLHRIFKTNTFSRQDLYKEMNRNGLVRSEALFKVKLLTLLNNNTIARVGRNIYTLPENNITIYRHIYSEWVNKIIDELGKSFPYIKFMIIESIQLNEFFNHLLAHNIVIISVEKDFEDFVFDTLRQIYQGHVLFNPSKEICNRYWSDNMIIINRLITEAPKSKHIKWETKLEKLLVDVVADPILHDIIGKSEYSNIFEGAFNRYIIDENSLFRYARRRGVEREIEYFIRNETPIQLKTR